MKKDDIPGNSGKEGASRSDDRRKALGKKGEDLGAAWLSSKGMRILARNYRCRLGEIDLVGQIGDTIVIVEIRSRSSSQWGTPAESVRYKKRQKLKKLAAEYMCQHGKSNCNCRIDVLGLLFGEHDTAGASPQIEWYPNAF